MVKVCSDLSPEQQLRWRFSSGGCGIFLYLNRNLANLVSRLPVVILLRPSLTDCTLRSANPFDAGCFGVTLMCLIPFLLMNV